MSDLSSQNTRGVHSRQDFEKKLVAASPKNMVTVTEEKEKENSKSTIEVEKTNKDGKNKVLDKKISI